MSKNVKNKSNNWFRFTSTLPPQASKIASDESIEWILRCFGKITSGGQSLSEKQLGFLKGQADSNLNPADTRMAASQVMKSFSEKEFKFPYFLQLLAEHDTREGTALSYRCIEYIEDICLAFYNEGDGQPISSIREFSDFFSSSIHPAIEKLREFPIDDTDIPEPNEEVKTLIKKSLVLKNRINTNCIELIDKGDPNDLMHDLFITVVQLRIDMIIDQLMLCVFGDSSDINDAQLAFFRDVSETLPGGRSEREIRRRIKQSPSPSMSGLSIIQSFADFERRGGRIIYQEVMESIFEIGSHAVAISNGNGKNGFQRAISELIACFQEYGICIDQSRLESTMGSQDTLEHVLEQLEGLIGLSDVKENIKSLVNLLKIRQMRQEKGAKGTPISFHLVFTGNPGTGKTTVARLVGNLYKHLGVVSKGQLIEVDRAGLVAGYVGQTAIKVKEVIDRAKGGILFIDEAYSLSSSVGNSDYGKEAIETILKYMEDYRNDLVVIVAGYTRKMEEFLNSNPGLRSRFNRFIEFPDYSPMDLYEIFVKLCTENGFTYNQECASLIFSKMEEMYKSRDASFGNARAVRNFFEKTISHHANRVSKIPEPNDHDLHSFQENDI